MSKSLINKEKNIGQRERTRKETVLSATKVIKNIVNMDDINIKHKKCLLNLMIWIITEAGGKYNTIYYSKDVKRRKIEKIKGNKGLIHEHVFMRKNLVEKLIKNPKRVEIILKKAIACTVTKKEDDRLRGVDNIYKNIDGWKRYKKAGIKAYERISNRRII